MLPHCSSPSPQIAPVGVEADTDPLIGQVLCRRYEIVAPIAAGGMGRVYRAIQRPLDRLVALKVFHPRFGSTTDPAFEERFFYEALMTAKLRHPNTVTLFDYGRSEEGLYFMALELVGGESLQQLLVRSGPLPWSRALAIGAQVARSLREAHSIGLVHRDLKPGNIMVMSEAPWGDRVKVLDFGLVRRVKGLAETASEEAISLTEAGVVLGSPLYMAPEQARKEVDLRSDIYSLGCVLFAAVSGRTPFLGKKPLEVLMKHMREPPPRLAALVDVPEDVDALVMKCLAKAPKDRFQTMDELLLAVHRVVRGHDLGGLFVESNQPVAPARSPKAEALPRLPPRLPASAAMKTPVPNAPLHHRGLHQRPWRWRRPFTGTALTGLGLLALAAALAATTGALPAHASREPDAASAHLGLEPAEEGLRHGLDAVPQPSVDPLPSRPQLSRRATGRVAKPATTASPKVTTASPKRAAPPTLPTLPGFRSNPFE